MLLQIAQIQHAQFTVQIDFPPEILDFCLPNWRSGRISCQICPGAFTPGFGSLHAVLNWDVNIGRHLETANHTDQLNEARDSRCFGVFVSPNLGQFTTFHAGVNLLAWPFIWGYAKMYCKWL